MALEAPQSVAAAVLDSSSGLGSAQTVPTGVRFYASKGNTTGVGVPNASRAVSGIGTTVMSPAALTTSVLLGGGGAAYYLSERE